MATAEELRRLREEQSIFSALYDMARQQQSELAAEGRRPVLGGLLSKEPTYGTDTLRYEGIGDMLVGLLTPVAKAVDAPISAYRGTIPQEDMISEALGVGGLAMAGGGAVGVPRGAVGANAVRNIKDKYPDVEIDIYGDADRGYELGRIQVPKDQQSSGVGSQVMNDLIAAADAEGAKISLTPDTSFGGTSVSRLKDFYKRFGFVENKGRNKDFSTRNTMYRDPTAMANASKSAGLLTTAASEAQDMAKRILELRAQGRASEVTDEMMAQADPQYMFANTPLPMDEASRMARAEAAGFDVGNVSYHGTKAANLDRFNPEFIKQGLGGKVIYSTDTPEIASGYAGSDMPYDPTPIGSGILPLLLRGNRKAMPASDLAKGENLYFENVKKNIQAAKDEGFSGMDLQTTDPTGAKVQTTFDTSDLRSRFARFDPEFAHLSNLSAANVSPLGGLLAQSGVSDKQAERIEEYLRRRGLLD